MYSVVLAVALTSGGDVTALGHGCNGGSWGCYGGSYSGCGCCGSKHSHHSCKGGGFFGGHHNSCYGGGHGCGGGHKHHRGHGCCGYSSCGCGYSACGCGYDACGCGCGSSYGGGWGGYGIGGTVVPGTVAPGTVVPSTTPSTTPETPKTKKTSIENATPAKLVVNIPANARLTVDGEATTSTGAQRTFVTPALEAGRTFHYTLQAEIVKDGKTITVKKNVAVTAGEESRVSIDADNVEFIDN